MKTTIVIPVSRPDYLHRIFAQLDLMPCNQEEISIIAYIDGDLQLYEVANNLVVNSKFKEKSCVFRHKGIPNVGSVKRRRERIAAIHNELKALIKKCDYVFILEDDTLPPLNIFERLITHMSSYPHAGFISAVEIGRWGYPMIGAWTVNDVYDPTVLITVPEGEGVIRVDAAGLYCCMMRYDMYLKHTFKPFLDILGPDVDMGLELRKVGYSNYIDYDLKCKHLTKRGEMTFDKIDIVQVEIKRTQNGWNQHQV